ncbi:MAG: YcxB family protein [Methylovulum sp.]|jgi:hypothetical protein|nr:YcxB family protein [Methylovulum sp.]TSA40639.1 MAG: YcxB family protein [Methylococcaceae bacterium]
MFDIEYEFTEEDLVHFNELQFMRNEEIQQDIRKNRWIVPGVMALIGSFYYFYYGDWQTSAYILLIALLWALLSPKVMLLDLHRQVLKSYSDKEKNAMFGKYKLSIDPQNAGYLLEKSPSGSHKMTWSELLRVEYGKRYVYIYINLTTALVIPLKKVVSGDLEKFAEQVEIMIDRNA